MTAIVGLEPVTLEPLLARVNSARSPVYLANINADKQVVIAGSDDAMRAVAELARQGVAVQVKRLAVSVPSHCALLEQPARELAQAFAKVTLQAPVLGYLSGSSARRLVKAEQLRDDLANNMCRLIDWRATVQSAWERGVRLQIEMPPGTVLTGLARKVLEPGTAIAYAGARLDTLQALMKQEEYRDP
ncbi:Malonyl CoA-acyl carrier protein transacylase [compost metagenome]